MRIHRFSLVVMAVLTAFFIVPGSFASTIHVPKDQPTIQAGINAANNGDTVLVAPGTYKENINFDGKAIKVASSGGPKVTTIDGGGLAPVAAFATSEGPGSILSGFTLQNGVGTFPFEYMGGGASILNSSPTITHNVIKKNTANSGEGGGVGVYWGSPTITWNLITNNSAAFGGGISFIGTSNAQVLHNTISSNTGGSGGAFELFGAANVLIEDNKVLGNSAPQGGQGGGFWIVNEADEIIVQNLIAYNTASSGSQIYSLIPQSSKGFELINNTIASAPAGGADAAVVADGFNTNVLIENNIIFAPKDGAALLCNPIYNDGPPIVQYDDAFSHGTSYGDSCAGFGGQNGNISADPKFVNPTKRNYQLRKGSPAINAGTNSAPNLPKKDLAGHRRIVGGIIDMGAYEYQGK